MSNASPVVIETTDFYDALSALQDGRKITKQEWGTEDIYCFLKDEKVQIHNETGDHDWILQKADLIGTDWRIL